MRPGDSTSCTHPGCTLDADHNGDHIGFTGKSCGCKNERIVERRARLAEYPIGSNGTSTPVGGMEDVADLIEGR